MVWCMVCVWYVRYMCSLSLFTWLLPHATNFSTGIVDFRRSGKYSSKCINKLNNRRRIIIRFVAFWYMLCALSCDNIALYRYIFSLFETTTFGRVFSRGLLLCTPGFPPFSRLFRKIRLFLCSPQHTWRTTTHQEFFLSPLCLAVGVTTKTSAQHLAFARKLRSVPFLSYQNHEALCFLILVHDDLVELPSYNGWYYYLYGDGRKVISFGERSIVIVIVGIVVFSFVVVSLCQFDLWSNTWCQRTRNSWTGIVTGLLQIRGDYSFGLYSNRSFGG
jgi:hypothetical protein